MASAGLQMTAVPDDPALFDLPWHLPLEDWPADRLVALPRGLSRHVVRFVRLSGRVYAVKESGSHTAEREFRLLRGLERRDVPCVEAVGVVLGRTDNQGEPLEPVLVTRHLQFSLPYRALFSGTLRPATANRLLDALALLLVRLHLAGFRWGDCSLSNTLFRRDAGAFAAYLVDAETGELHEQLTDGQREHDLDIAGTNIGGELMDLEAGGLLHPSMDPLRICGEVMNRYRNLWAELLDTQPVPAGERFRVEERVRRLNDLGFDVAEMTIARETDGSDRLLVSPKVVDAGHHTRRLLRLTGLDVQENQARRLLNDLDRYRAYRQLSSEDEEFGAHLWLTEIFEPVVRTVPRELRGKLEPAELFHEILEHRWFRSEAAGADIGTFTAARDYVETVLGAKPDERAVVEPAMTEDDAEVTRVPAS